MLDQGGDSREDLGVSKAQLAAELKALTKQLAAYSDNDPIELERKRKQVQEFRADVEACTDDIYAMEGWFSKQIDRVALEGLRGQFYGDELDPESKMLREME